MARVNFPTVFTHHQTDNTLELKHPIRIAGTTYAQGITFPANSTIGTVNFTPFIGNDLEIETDGDIFVIKAIYARSQPSHTPNINNE